MPSQCWSFSIMKPKQFSISQNYRVYYIQFQKVPVVSGNFALLLSSFCLCSGSYHNSHTMINFQKQKILKTLLNTFKPLSRHPKNKIKNYETIYRSAGVQFHNKFRTILKAFVLYRTMFVYNISLS